MAKSNILLIGAGQLGSRHLQGLAKIEDPLIILIVEPYTLNLEIAISRFKEIDGYEKHVIFTYNSLHEIPNLAYNLAIIATNADIRAEIAKQLVTLYEVSNIIFEKVAFQSENQFIEIINLLQSRSIKSWVNCPRRHFPFYQKLKDHLKGNGPIKLLVEGIDWGLACNSVHQIDLLAFLSGETRYQIEENQLHNKIYDSKRKNFIEFYGTYSGKSDTGNCFNLRCELIKEISEKPFVIHRIETLGETILINEAQGIAEFFQKGSNIPFHKEVFNIIYQSALTNIQVQQIMQTGLSYLPTIEESFEIHKPLFKILNEQYFKISGKKIDTLPIT